VSHARILVGSPASTNAYATVLAKGANCLNAVNNDEPCEQCISCKLFNSGNHPDTFYVTKSKLTGIGVDDVRSQIVEPMGTKPFGYKYKVFIIDKSETLTPAAQSALLKTIEEPAPYGFFLFLAPHSHNFLPTILSRCHLHKVRDNTNTSHTHNPELATLANEIVNAKYTDILDALTFYKKIEPYKDSKENLQELLDLIYHAYGRKIAAVTETGQPPAEWLNAAIAITNTKKVLSQNGNTQLALELLLIELFGKGQHLQ